MNAPEKTPVETNAHAKAAGPRPGPTPPPGTGASREARRLAAAILEVLAGARSPTEAAQALGCSQPRYYALEARALRALVCGCESRPRGHRRSAALQLEQARRECERLQRECARMQALARVAQRSVGLAPPNPAARQGPGKGKPKRRRRPAVRALRMADVIQSAPPGETDEGPAGGQPSKG
jgi:hypothetical protein